MTLSLVPLKTQEKQTKRPRRSLYNDKEDIPIVNIYAPNMGASKSIKQILTEPKAEINSNILTAWDFHTLLPTMDRHS